MSRTDKTGPWWLRMWWEPYHSYRCHRGEGCNLPVGPPLGGPPLTWKRFGHCYWWPDSPRYYSFAGRKLHGRGTRVGYAANRQERGFRAAWRATAAALRAVRRDDVDDVDLPELRHRHNAAWEWHD